MRNVNVIAYPFRLEEDKEGGGYVVFFDDFPGGTQGETKEEAMESAQEFVDDIICIMLENKEEVPAPSKKTARRMFAYVEPVLAGKLLLHWKMQDGHIRKADLARKLHWDQKEVTRVLSPRYKSGIAKVEQSLAALGCKMVTGWV